MSKQYGIAVGLIIAIFGAQATHAQELEEITVTAQKRSENLRDVPISVSAVTGSVLTTQGITTTEDLSSVVPGLTMARETSAVLIYLRGVGTQGGTLGEDASVATFVDGVYISAVTGTQFGLSNVDRIEVLKGPQGTLYGRNATGGAINIITKTPSETPSIDAEIGYGNLSSREGQLYVTGGITHHVAADLSVYYAQDDGFGRNVFTGENVNGRKDFDVRSKILWTPGEDTKVTLGLSYTYSNETTGLRPSYNSVPVTGQPYHGGFWDTDTDVQPRYFTKQDVHYLRIDQDLSWATLTNISAWQKAKQYQNGDLDASPIPLINFQLFSTDETVTEELQLQSPSNSTVKWIVGGYFLHGFSEYDPFQLYGLGLAPATHEAIYDDQITKSISAYGQMSIPIAMATNLTLGGRYTHDVRDLTANGFLNIPPALTIPVFAPVDTSRTFAKPTWRLGVDHHFTDELMVYLTYNRGFKSGVYNLSVPNAPPVNPEVIDAYEIGIKTDLLDHRVRINSSAFDYQYKGIQLSQLVGNSEITLNAAAAKIYGVDVDIAAGVTDKFTIGFGGEWLHARYSNFPNAPIYAPIAPPGFGNSITPGNGAGNTMILAPAETANISADYRWPLNEAGRLNYNLTYAYNAGFYWGSDDTARQPHFGLVNSQLKWTSPGQTYDIILWGKNLFNQQYYAQINEGALVNSSAPAAGRTFGVRFGVKF
jgi:iron complex outermembrane recepter protein